MKVKKEVLAVILSIIGWISLIIGGIATFGFENDNAILFLSMVVVIPFVLSMAAVCLILWSIVKKERNWIWAVIGMVVGLPLLLVSGYLLISLGRIGFNGGIPAIEELIRLSREAGEQAIEVRQNSIN